MNLIWHITKKDLRRFRLPLVLWTLLLVGEVILYLVISGALTGGSGMLSGGPDIAWLWRVNEPTQLFLRNVAPGILVYLLVGWLVYTDPVVEPDPFWITRPISGAQLFVAKVLGAGLMFVALPVLINFPWWLACGFGGRELASAAGNMAAISGIVVALGLAFASLTNNFQRYILWSIVGFVVVFMIMGAIGPIADLMMTGRIVAVPGATFATQWYQLLGAAILGLVVAGHQHVTRRLRRSIVVGLIGAFVAGVGAKFWYLSPVSPSPAALADPVALQVTMAGPARPTPKRRAIDVPLTVKNVMPPAAVTGVTVKGNWWLNQARLWNATGRQSTREMMERVMRDLLLETAESGRETSYGPFTVSIPLSPAIAQQFAESPLGFRGDVELFVSRARVMAQMSLREHSVRTDGQSYTISALEAVPLTKKRQDTVGVPHDGRAIRAVLTERAGQEEGFEWFRSRRPMTRYALVRRTTGEILFEDRVGTGPTGATFLNRVNVTNMMVMFVTPNTDAWMKDATLAVIRLQGLDTIARTVEAKPFPFQAEAAPEPAAWPGADARSR